MGVIYLCIPIGAALMLVESLAVARRLLRDGAAAAGPPTAPPAGP
jgi:TRAP-type C4-dicarboxylate transport system permease small subunit